MAFALLACIPSCRDDKSSSRPVVDGGIAVMDAANGLADVSPRDSHSSGDSPKSEILDTAVRFDASDAEDVKEEPFCIPDWPAGPVDETPDKYVVSSAPPLKMLRSFDALAASAVAFLTKSGRNLAFTDTRIIGVDVANSKAFPMPGGGSSNPPVTDDDGVIYGATSEGAKSFRFGAAGLELLWQGPTWGSNPFSENPKAADFARSPAGKLFTISWDGTAYGINAATGKVLWSKPNKEGPARATVSFGVGNYLLASFEGKGNSEGLILDSLSGERVGRVEPTSKWVSPGVPLRLGGYLGTVYPSSSSVVPEIVRYDQCGRRVWVRPIRDGTLLPLVFSGDRLIELNATGRQVAFVDGKNGDIKKLLVFDSPSTFRVRGIFQGSDGLQYFLTCDSEGQAAPQITVFTEDYSRVGNMELRRDGVPLECPDPTIVFAGSNQIALLSRDSNRNMAMISLVQVPSPAMASSAWPTFRGDETGGRWLK